MIEENVLQKTYDIQFHIGDLDYSCNIYKVEMASSTQFIFNAFLIGLLMDPGELLEESTFGQNEAHLTVSLTAHEGIIEGGQIDLKLIILKMLFPVTPRERSKPGEESFQPRRVILICIPKIPFLTMYTPVNKIIQNNSNLTPLDVVELIIKDFLKGTQNKVDRKNENKTSLFQLLIAPTSFVNSVKYIDKKYSLYRGGESFIFCRADDNQLCIWDLRQRFRKDESPEYTVHLLTSGIPEKDEILETPGDEDHFFTFTNIKTRYKGNQKVAQAAFQNTFFTKPLDQLHQVMNISLDSVFKENSLTDNLSELQFDKDLKKLKRFYPNVASVEDSEYMPRKFLANQIKDLSEISFTIDSGDLPFTKLSRVGVKINLEATKDIYATYQGSYIAKRSFIVWTRKTKTQDFQCNALITCMRGYYE